jgi:hypothetical protein
MQAAGRSAECELLNLVVWAKTNGGMGSRYRSRHELYSYSRMASRPKMRVQYSCDHDVEAGLRELQVRR